MYKLNTEFLIWGIPFEGSRLLLVVFIWAKMPWENNNIRYNLLDLTRILAYVSTFFTVVFMINDILKILETLAGNTWYLWLIFLFHGWLQIWITQTKFPKVLLTCLLFYLVLREIWGVSQLFLWGRWWEMPILVLRTQVTVREDGLSPKWL